MPHFLSLWKWHVSSPLSGRIDRNGVVFDKYLTLSTVAIAGYFINYATEVRSNTSSALGAIYLAVAQGCFAVGRFSGSLAMKFIKPRSATPFFPSPLTASHAAIQLANQSHHYNQLRLPRLPLMRHHLQRRLHHAEAKHRHRHAKPHALLRERLLPHHRRSGHPRHRPPHQAWLRPHCCRRLWWRGGATYLGRDGT